ncbi:MAG: hypothetical protein CSA35_05100 [Dethiosulfovibrio peptidovorans]|nr:MAG: hypothetical protein CSA35_05100 [Dethiosulfovibrio peptidovorans]
MISSRFLRIFLVSVTFFFVLSTVTTATPQYPSDMKQYGRFVQMRCFNQEWRSSIQNVIARYFDVVNDGISHRRGRTYGIYVSRSSLRYRVDPFLIAAVMIQRSRLVWTSSKGDQYGLMGLDWGDNKRWIMEDHPRITSRRILCKPVLNIRVGTDLMSRNLEKSGQDYGAMVNRWYDDAPGSAEVIWEHYGNMVHSFQETVENEKTP